MKLQFLLASQSALKHTSRHRCVIQSSPFLLILFFLCFFLLRFPLISLSFFFFFFFVWSGRSLKSLRALHFTLVEEIKTWSSLEVPVCFRLCLSAHEIIHNAHLDACCAPCMLSSNVGDLFCTYISTVGSYPFFSLL